MDRRTLDVFISHAVEYGTRGEKFLFELSNDLAGKGLRAFINQDIPVGDAWHPAVVTALADCRAAIVLLDQRALESS